MQIELITRGYMDEWFSGGIGLVRGRMCQWNLVKSFVIKVIKTDLRDVKNGLLESTVRWHFEWSPSISRRHPFCILGNIDGTITSGKELRTMQRNHASLLAVKSSPFSPKGISMEVPNDRRLYATTVARWGIWPEFATSAPLGLF